MILFWHLLSTVSLGEVPSLQVTESTLAVNLDARLYAVMQKIGAYRLQLGTKICEDLISVLLSQRSFLTQAWDWVSWYGAMRFKAALSTMVTAKNSCLGLRYSSAWLLPFSEPRGVSRGMTLIT